MAKARNWRDVRAELIAAGLLDEARIAEHRARLLAEVRAYQQAEVRRRAHHGRVTPAAGVSQSDRYGYR